MTVGCIGTGMMGGALLRGIVKEVLPSDIMVYDADLEKAKILADELNVKVASDIIDLAKKCDYIIIAVKPAHFYSVINEISSCLTLNKVLISIAAGINLCSIKNGLKEKSNIENVKIIRLMPNLPATVGQAMIALSANEFVEQDEICFVKKVLTGAGKVEQISESLMDCVTGVSGSGPAYGFMFIEAMADGAVLCGMPRNQAYIYAAQTLKGAADMVLNTQNHPGALKDAVCSPGGTTIEGVKALEAGGFRNTIINAVIEATKKSIELGKCN